jgi:hypothetical protein
MIERAFAESFARDWIAAWNSRDLDRVLAHYADDFQMSSPFIVETAQEPSGRLRGKQAVGAYWARRLALQPDLRFQLRAVMTGMDSIIVLYDRMDSRVGAEYFEFDADGNVHRSAAHYE